MDIITLYIIASYFIGFVSGAIVTHALGKEGQNTVKLLALLFLIFFSGLSTYLLYNDKDVPIFLQLIMLGLASGVLEINLSEAFGMTEKIQKLKNVLKNDNK